MHIHGVFPYLYVPYDGTQPLDQFLQQFAVSIDTAINIVLGNASSNRQHVYKISVVSGM
jgi:DNA polymerase zeta